MLSRLELHYTNVHRSGTSAVCQRTVIEKVRYKVPHNGLMWEVDVFEGRNTGLVIAEVELSHSHQTVTLPSWVGREITADDRYGNSTLSVWPVGSPKTTAKWAKPGEQTRGYVRVNT
jgi:CYTH domain-containing protein